ncbi:MAG: MFS transporter [Odoribacter splanchnicus]
MRIDQYNAGVFVFGRFSDKYGYLFFFRLCPLVIAGFAGVYFSHSLVVLTVCLLLIGFAIGGAYALDPSYVSEIMPKKWKRTMLGISKATSGLGNIGMILVAWYVLKESSDPEIWNHLFLFLTFFAVVTFLARLWFVESPEWLALHGKVEKLKEYQTFSGACASVSWPVKDEQPPILPGYFLGKYIVVRIRGDVKAKIYNRYITLVVTTLGLIPSSKAFPGWSIFAFTFNNVFVMLGFIIGLTIVKA